MGYPDIALLEAVVTLADDMSDRYDEILSLSVRLV